MVISGKDYFKEQSEISSYVFIEVDDLSLSHGIHQFRTSAPIAQGITKELRYTGKGSRKDQASPNGKNWNQPHLSSPMHHGIGTEGVGAWPLTERLSC